MRQVLMMVLRALGFVAAVLGLYLTSPLDAHAKVIVDDGNTTKIYLDKTGKQISAREAYAEALKELDVLQCEHMDVKINLKTGKPSLTKSK